MAEKKQCYFCTSNIKFVDHKEVETLKHFLNAQARILPKRQSGVCALHQRKLASAIKKARYLALLPFVQQ